MVLDRNVIMQCMALHRTVRSPSIRILRVPYCMHGTWLGAVMTGGWVWRLINRNRIQIRVERAYRGSSHTLPLNVNYPKQEEMYFPSPTRRCFSTTAAGKRGNLLLTWQPFSQWKTISTQPMKSHYTSNSQFPPMDSLFATAPLNSPFPL